MAIARAPHRQDLSTLRGQMNDNKKHTEGLEHIRVVIEWLALGGKAVGMFIILGLTLMVVAAVVRRYIFGKALLFTDEIGAYSLAILTFLGAAETFRDGSHIRVEVLLRIVPSTVLQWFRVVGLVCATGYLGILSFYMMVDILWQMHHKIGAIMIADFPIWWPMVGVLAGMIILFLILGFAACQQTTQTILKYMSKKR